MSALNLINICIWFLFIDNTLKIPFNIFKITWFHEEVDAGDGGGRYVPLVEGNFCCLDVSPVFSEDGGLWTCRAFAESGAYSECSAYLNVLSKISK